MTYLERSVHLRSNSLSQSLTALPAPSEREPLARPEDLHFNRKLYRHAKGPIPEGAGIERSEMTGGVSSAAKFPPRQNSQTAPVHGTVWLEVHSTGFMLAGSSTTGAPPASSGRRFMPPGFGATVGRVNTNRHHSPCWLSTRICPPGKVHQHLADVQAQTRAPGMQAAGAVLLVEPLEHVGQRFRADALTGVPDGDLGFRAKLFHPEADGAARRRET